MPAAYSEKREMAAIVEMTRREIIEEAKWLVLYHGPSNILEFGNELFDSHTAIDSPRMKYKEEIIKEAHRQADRVYRFLGYEPPE